MRRCLRSRIGSVGEPCRGETWCVTRRHLATRPEQQQRQRVLARQDATGATASKRDANMIDNAFVRFGAATRATTPQRATVAASSTPASRNSKRLRSGDRRRLRRQRENLLHLPNSCVAHGRHRSQRVQRSALGESHTPWEVCDCELCRTPLRVSSNGATQIGCAVYDKTSYWRHGEGNLGPTR